MYYAFVIYASIWYSIDAFIFLIPAPYQNTLRTFVVHSIAEFFNCFLTVMLVLPLKAGIGRLSIFISSLLAIDVFSLAYALRSHTKCVYMCQFHLPYPTFWAPYSVLCGCNTLLAVLAYFRPRWCCIVPRRAALKWCSFVAVAYCLKAVGLKTYQWDDHVLNNSGSSLLHLSFLPFPTKILTLSLCLEKRWFSESFFFFNFL